MAKFAADGLWYRARVEKVYAQDPTSPSYDMVFVDYGNKDRVGGKGVRPSPPDLSAVPAQAYPASLAFVRAPELDADYGVEAAQALSEWVGGGKTLKAFIEKRERVVAGGAGGGGGGRGWGNASAAASSPASSSQQQQKLHLTVLLGDDEDGEDLGASANARLVEEGFARVVEVKRKGGVGGTDSPAFEAVRAAQELARRRHAGMWEYGDPGSSDDDDGGFPSLGGARGGGGKK